VGGGIFSLAAIALRFLAISISLYLGIKSEALRNFNILRLFARQIIAILSHFQTFRHALAPILGMHSALVHLEQICIS
jgi:hypothetical protein